MDDLEEKLGQLLGNPQLMQQVISMAQSLGQSDSAAETGDPPGSPDLSMLRNLSGILGQGGVDSNQQALLNALTPYLSQDKVGRLQRAMQAAGMAKAASSFLGSGGLQLLTGR